MQYMGSKTKISKHILPFILKDRKENQSPEWLVKKMLSKVDFETSKEYKQIAKELAIDTKKVLMLN